MIPVNTLICDRYRVVRSLGGGATKQVYLAEVTRLAHRPFALALMIDNFANADAQRQAVTAYQRETDMLARLDHDRIVKVFDRFSDQNRHYLVMEYVHGNTLEEQLARAGSRLEQATVAAFALQI